MHTQFSTVLRIEMYKNYYNLGPATALMDMLMQPIHFFLHSKSVDISTFVDDSISISISESRANTCLKIIKFVFQAAGWEIEDSKTVYPCQVIYYLGFILNSLTMTVTAPFLKLQSLADDINQVIEYFKREGKIVCKDMAHILGVCCHLLSSHGNIMRVATRGNQHALGLAVQDEGWDGFMILNDRLIWELHFIQDILIRFK